MTLLAAFNTCSTATGQEDILVGSPIANRNRSETEGLIGFVNTLLSRVTPVLGADAASTRSRLGAAHQDLPSRSWNYSRSGTSVTRPCFRCGRPSECSHAS